MEAPVQETWTDVPSPIAAKPASGSAESWTTVPTQNNTMFHEERNQVMSIPTGLSESETNFQIATQVDKKPKKDFFGMIEYGADVMAQLPKGLLNFAVTTTPETVGTLIKEYAANTEAEQRRTLDSMPTNVPHNMFQKLSTDFAWANIEASKTAAKLGERLVSLSKEYTKQNLLDRPVGDNAKAVSFDVGSAAGSVAGSVGMAFATKNPAAVATAFTAIFKAQKYQEMVDKGFTPETASTESTLSSIPQFALEFTGAHVMLHAFQASKPMARLAIRLAEEPLQEGGQQAAEEVTDKFFNIKNDSREEITKRIMYAAALGLVGGAPISIAATHIETAVNQTNETLDRAALNHVLSIANEMGVHDMIMGHGLTMQDADIIIENKTNQLVKMGALDEATKILSDELSPMAHDDISIPGVEKLGDLPGGDFIPAEPTTQKTFSQQLEEAIVSSNLEDKAHASALGEALSGRMSVLDGEAKGVSEQMHTLEKEKVAKIKAGKSFTTIQTKLDKLQKQFDSIDAQRGDLLTTAKDQLNVAEEPVLVKGKQLSGIALRNRLAGFREGAKTGRQLTLAEVRKVQRDLLNYLRTETRLTPQDRAQFISNILSNTTEESLARNIGEIEKKVKAVEEKADVKGLRERITKLLDSIDPIGGTSPKGKFTPEIQRILTRIKDVSKLSIEDGVKLIADNLTKQDDLITPEQALENKIIDLFAGLKGKDSLQLKEALDELDAIYNSGRAIALLKYMDKVEKKKEIINKALADIVGSVVDEKPISIPKTQMERNKRAFDHFMKSFGKSLSLNWKQLTDVFSQDSDSKAGESFLTKFTDLRPNTASWIGQRERHLKEFLANYVMPNTGITSAKEFADYLKTLHETVSLGVFRDNYNRLIDMTYTKDQIIGFWTRYQDPSLKSSFTNTEHDGNGFSPMMIQALNEYVERSARDTGYAKATLKFYQDFYGYINESFADRSGVNLPQNPWYSPVRRVLNAEVEAVNPFAEEISPEGSLSSGSLKSRIGSQKAIKMTGAYATLAQHINDMTFYVEASEKIQMTEAIFKDPRVREAIVEKFGQGAYTVAMDKIKYFKRRGIVAREMVVPWIDALRRARTLGSLYKPYQYVKQMTGVFSYMSHVNTQELLGSIADLAKDGKAKLQVLYDNSPVLQSRMGNLSVDISDALGSKQAATFLDSPTWSNFMLFFSRHGALHADMIGGYAVYQKEMKSNGGDPKAAIAKMEDVMLDVQPSSLMTEQTDWQQKGSLYRMMSLFMSAQNKYFQLEQNAIRNAIKGRMPIKDAAKIVFLYHIFLPSLFQFVADYGKWKWPEQMRAMALGSFNGIFLAGDYIENAARLLLHYGFQQEGVRVFDRNKGDLFIMGADELTKAVKSFDHNTIMASDVFDAVGHLLAGAAQTAGIPTKYATENVPNTIESVNKGDILKAMMAVSGATKFQLEEDN